jgi:hypothetical protein
MKQPAPRSTSPSSLTDLGQQFSHANLFGIFLTLQLCQFTQPHGSLLFRGLGGLFWRCNPIASFTEACIILWYLTRAAFSSSRQGPGLQHALHRAKVFSNLQATASGLLLLRSHTKDETSSDIVERLLRRSSSKHEGESLILDVTEEEGQQEMAQTMSSPDPIDIPSIGMASGQDDDSGTLRTSVFQRRTTGGLEANIPPATEQIMTPRLSGQVSERSRMLQTAFGSNALAHREWRIDLVTTASVFLIIIKLGAVEKIPIFRLVCSLMITGWLAVQALLTLLHSREMDENGMEASIKSAQELDEQLQKFSTKIQVLYLIFHLPLGFLCVWKLFHNDWVRPGNIFSILSILFFVATLISGITFGVTLLVNFLVLLAALFLSTFNLLKALLHGRCPTWSDISKGQENHGPAVLWFFFSLWTSVGCLNYSLKRMRVDTAPPLITEKTPLWYIVEWGFGGSMAFCLAAILVYVVFLILWHIFFDYQDRIPSVNRRVVATTNAILTIGFCLWYMLAVYNPENTYKPVWTEWLG